MPGLNLKGWIYLFISVTLRHLHLHTERKYILEGFLNQLWMHFSSSRAEDRSVLLRKTVGAGVWHSTSPPLQPALTLVNVNITREETLPLLWLLAPICNSFSTRIFLLCSGSLVPLQITDSPSYIIPQLKQWQPAAWWLEGTLHMLSTLLSQVRYIWFQYSMALRTKSSTFPTLLVHCFCKKLGEICHGWAV